MERLKRTVDGGPHAPLKDKVRLEWPAIAEPCKTHCKQIEDEIQQGANEHSHRPPERDG